MLRYAMERGDFEELFLLGPGEADAEERRGLLEAEYPKSTGQAVVELRTRGLEATEAVLDYLIEKGAISSPGRRWPQAQVEA